MNLIVPGPSKVQRECELLATICYSKSLCHSTVLCKSAVGSYNHHSSTTTSLQCTGTEHFKKKKQERRLSSLLTEMVSEREVKMYVNGEAGEDPVNNVSHTESKSSANKEKKDKKKPMVSTLAVFRYSNCVDKLLMVIGTVLAALHGAALPCMMIIFGDMTDDFVNSAKNNSRASNETLEEQMTRFWTFLKTS